MLDDKVPKAKKKPSLTISTCSNPVSDDEDFKISTLSYLSSPTAKTLGLSGSPVSQNVAETPKSRTFSPVSPTVHKAADNLVCAPPNFPLPSLPESCYGSRSRSRSPSDLFLEDTIDTLSPLLSLFPSIWRFKYLFLESDSIRSFQRNLESGKLWTNRHWDNYWSKLRHKVSYFFCFWRRPRWILRSFAPFFSHSLSTVFVSHFESFICVA